MPFFGLHNGIEKFNGALYAHLRGRSTSLALEERLPLGVSSDGLLFKGAPDFMFKWMPVNVVHNAGDDDGDDDDGSSDTSTSGESIKMEHAHQLPPNTAYKSGSKIPNKGGQLVAAIHQSILAKLLRKLYKNKEIILRLRGHGLYIHKITGAIHFQVVLHRSRRIV